MSGHDSLALSYLWCTSFWNLYIYGSSNVWTFHPLFFWVLFQPNHVLPFWDSDYTNVIYFLIDFRPSSSVHFFSVFSHLFFGLGNFYCPIFQFSDPVFSLFLFAFQSYPHRFLFQLLYFYICNLFFYVFYLLFDPCFFAEAPSFFICFKSFVIDHWRTFIRAVFTFLSDDSDISHLDIGIY